MRKVAYLIQVDLCCLTILAGQGAWGMIDLTCWIVGLVGSELGVDLALALDLDLGVGPDQELKGRVDTTS